MLAQLPIQAGQVQGRQFLDQGRCKVSAGYEHINHDIKNQAGQLSKLGQSLLLDEKSDEQSYFARLPKLRLSSEQGDIAHIVADLKRLSSDMLRLNRAKESSMQGKVSMLTKSQNQLVTSALRIAADAAPKVLANASPCVAPRYSGSLRYLRINPQPLIEDASQFRGSESRSGL